MNKIKMEGIMIKSTNLNIRIDKSTKETSEKIFEELGLNMTTAINMFLRQVIRTKGIPFELKSNGNIEEVNEEKPCIIKDIKKYE